MYAGNAAVRAAPAKLQAPPSFKILRTLGAGGQGQVFLAIHTSSPQGFLGASVRCPVALKVLEKERLVHNETRKKLAREISIISKLNHPGACSLVLPAFQDESRFYVPMPYFPGGCLSSHLGGGARFSERRAVWAILFPLMDAVAFCHSRGIIHRDIKSENLLVKLDPQQGQSSGVRATQGRHARAQSAGRVDVIVNGNAAGQGSPRARTPMGGMTKGGSGKLSQIVGVVLTDFGLAVDTSCGQRPKSPVGTLDCMSPEMLCACRDPEARAQCSSLEWAEGMHCACPSYLREPSPQSAQVDVWAIGVLAYELITGRSPFEYRGKRGQAPAGSVDAVAAWCRERTEVRHRILTSESGDLHFPPYVTAGARDFICGALCKDAAQRSDLWTLLHHPWIVQYVKGRDMDEQSKPWLACLSGVSARGGVRALEGAASWHASTRLHPSTVKTVELADVDADRRVRGGQKFAGFAQSTEPPPGGHFGPGVLRPLPVRHAPQPVEVYSNGYSAGRSADVEPAGGAAETPGPQSHYVEGRWRPSEAELDSISSALEGARLEPARKRMHDNEGRTRDTRGAEEARAEDMVKSSIASLALRAGGKDDTDSSVRNGKSREGSVHGERSTRRFSAQWDDGLGEREHSDSSGLDSSLSGGKRCLAELELMGLGGNPDGGPASRPPLANSGRKAGRASGIAHDVSLRGRQEAITILRNVPSVSSFMDEGKAGAEGSDEVKRGKKGKGMWHKAMKMMGAR